MKPEQNKGIKSIKYTELITTAAFGLPVFVFFAFLYEHHLLFTEQLQLFLLTDDYFLEKLILPGRLNGLIGEFLTQFYHVPLAGALIIAVLLVTIQVLTKKIIIRFPSGRSLFPLTFIPALISGFILCSELYPLSAITGFTFALAATNLYMNINNKKRRFIAGVLMIPALYYLAGGAYTSFVLLAIIYELIPYDYQEKAVKDSRDSGTGKRLQLRHIIFYLLLAACFPLIIRQFVIFQPVKQAFMSEFYYNIPDKIPPVIPLLFVIPALLTVISSLLPERFLKNRYSFVVQIIILLATLCYGFARQINFEAEEIMTYDYLARNQKWNEVILFADKRPPRNFLSLAMLNLSLAKTGQMGDKMFNYGQHGINGLFLRFEREFITPMMGNEIFYHLGLINASQQYIFESMEVMPNMEKSVRAIRRLAETNLINGHYKVTEKYLKLLEKTLFYRQWAKDTRRYLYNEELINNHPDWGEKRRMLVKEDFFFHVDDIESILHKLLRSNPGNKMALEYLAAYYLLNREMEAFVSLLPLMEKMNYRELPVSYQEAFVLYEMVTNRDLLAGSSYKVSQSIRSAMNAYASVYLNNPDARKILSQTYSGTYWYYFHYIE